MDDILRRVVQRLDPLFDADLGDIDPASPLREQPRLHYDSLTVMECVVAVQDEFGIDIDFATDDVLHTFVSLEGIARLVEVKLADKAALGPA